uniref:AlNc14C259G9778 protein n=1 Tax=Albugo laibachii Nc14 TaxID=890382 RepID=F0WTV3_9STRA|nr:AlNc14C259G9778 [Albugo laibachii Nc14]|eukprot:CCA24797.1 AlNc14C259G9778 [Albugo laibachii Nc14]
MEIDEDCDDRDAHTSENDVTMHVNTYMEIVLRGRLHGYNGYSIFTPSGTINLLQSKQSHSIFPYESSDAIAPITPKLTRPQKRFRIEQKQSNIALDAPKMYKEATRSANLNEWKNAIDQELQALNDKIFVDFGLEGIEKRVHWNKMGFHYEFE